MNAVKIEFDGVTLEVPASDQIKISSFGMYENVPLYAIVVFHYPAISKIAIHKYSQDVYKYAEKSISENEYHVKTIFFI